MKNTKTTKRALLSSVLALFLCVAMLTGTTFAWFTDTVSSGVNSIVAGNLDIEVEFSDDGASWANLDGTGSLFTTDKWEPGHTEIVYLKLTNAGTLALNYRVLVTPVSENGGVNVNGQAFKLSDYLVFGTTAPSETLTTYTRDEARAAVAANGTGLNVNRLTKTGTMDGKTTANTDVQYLALVVYMPEDIGNEANYKTGTAAPTIELGIKVLATQRTAENDSFGSDYDEDAVNTPFYTVGSYYDYYPQVSVSAPVAQSGDTVITATGKLNSTDTVDTILAKVTVPEGAALVAGTTELTVNVVPKDPEAATTNGTALVTEINNPDRDTANFDVKVVGIASSNTANIDVEIFVGKGLANVKVYHNGALIDGASYNAATGIVTFTTTSFSDYTVAYDMAAAAIGDKTYGSLALAMAAANYGETVTLLKDLDTGAGEAYPAGGNVYGIILANVSKNVTINGNGHKVTGTGTYILGLDQCTGNVTLTNITVEGTGETNKAAINMTGCNNVVLKNVKASGVKTGVIVNNTAATIKGDKTDIANGAWHAVNVDNGGTYNPRTPVLTVESGKIGTIWCERSGSASVTGGQIAVVGMAANGTGAISISGGEIGSAVKAEAATGSIAITGGKFSTDPGAYLSLGCEVVQNGDWYEIRNNIITPSNIADVDFTEANKTFYLQGNFYNGLTINEFGENAVLYFLTNTWINGNLTLADDVTITGQESQTKITGDLTATGNKPITVNIKDANLYVYKNISVGYTQGKSTLNIENSTVKAGTIFVGAHVMNCPNAEAEFNIKNSYVDCDESGISQLGSTISVWGKSGVDVTIIDSEVHTYSRGWHQSEDANDNSLTFQGGDHINVKFENSNFHLYGARSIINARRYYDNDATIDFQIDDCFIWVVTKSNHGESTIPVWGATEINDSVLVFTKNIYQNTPAVVKSWVYGNPVISGNYNITTWCGWKTEMVLENQTVTLAENANVSVPGSGIVSFVLSDGAKFVMESGATLTNIDIKAADGYTLNTTTENGVTTYTVTPAN